MSGVEAVAGDRKLAFQEPGLQDNLVKVPQAPHGMAWGNEGLLESPACFSCMQGKEKWESPVVSFSAAHS